MPCIYINSRSPSKDNLLELTGEKVHYILNVLRHKKGDNLILFNNEGRYFTSTIIDINKRRVIFKTLSITPPSTESYLNIIICPSLLKGSKMDLVVQKSTELGVKGIIPVISERSQLQKTRKLDRWRKIAIEGARQSGRNSIPEIFKPLDYKNLIRYIKDSQGRGIVFYEKYDETISIKKLSDISKVKCFILVGPEGGFSKKEIELAKAKGFDIVSMGHRMLRAETAAISALTLIQFLSGDMG